MPGPGRILSPTVTATHLRRRRAGPPVVRRFTTNREAGAAAERTGSGIAALPGGAHRPRTRVPAGLPECPCLAANARTLRIRTSLSRATDARASTLPESWRPAHLFAMRDFNTAGPVRPEDTTVCRRSTGRTWERSYLWCAESVTSCFTRPGRRGRHPSCWPCATCSTAGARAAVPLRLHQRRDRADSARGRGTGDGRDRLRDRPGSQAHALRPADGGGGGPVRHDGSFPRRAGNSAGWVGTGRTVAAGSADRRDRRHGRRLAGVNAAAVEGGLYPPSSGFPQSVVLCGVRDVFWDLLARAGEPS